MALSVFHLSMTTVAEGSNLQTIGCSCAGVCPVPCISRRGRTDEEAFCQSCLPRRGRKEDETSCQPYINGIVSRQALATRTPQLLDGLLKADRSSPRLHLHLHALAQDYRETG